MTDMLEKIARAIGERGGATEYGPIIPKALLPDLARAALLAMREPNDEILSAIQCCPLSDKARAATNSFDRMNASTEAMWLAGIDAILAQPSTPTDVTHA